MGIAGSRVPPVLLRAPVELGRGSRRGTLLANASRVASRFGRFATCVGFAWPASWDGPMPTSLSFEACASYLTTQRLHDCAAKYSRSLPISLSSEACANYLTTQRLHDCAAKYSRSLRGDPCVSYVGVEPQTCVEKK